TGSGKTEVYFEAIAETLRQGRQALVLLPEIALTAQFLHRFEARFGVAPAEWHSQLPESKRRAVWRAVAGGQARVAAGARSALYLPFPDLGLIIVDEEHDAAYKQEEGVIYHARDMAVVRAHLGGMPIVLSSATPSLETMVNAQNGRYAHLILPDRHGGAQLASIEAVDMRHGGLRAGQFLSPRLRQLMAETLARGEQVMLFLNRRGYAPLTLCRACGSRMECPNCSVWLVEHRFHNRLLCHHCGHETPKPQACPACGVSGAMVALGPGIERLAEETAAAFPEFTPALLSGDQDMEETRRAIAAFTRGETRILIGTQIISKGHHFPRLTLAGVIDADLGLAGGDLRAAERTFQLLHQVSGRAGRAEHPGHAVLQTYMPEHPVMQALISGDQEKFLAAETQARRARGLPPFGRLAALIVSGPDQAEVRQLAALLARHAPQSRGLQVFGPAPAPLALLRGRHRYRLLLTATRQHDVQGLLRQWLGRVKVPRQIRLAVDVDPYGFL
ncbi:MAG: primosomal protein N', partial [Alphaproteobacteria bacterium]|nr:primosomal protein N' [Alphaproteobacteria bacterium]